MPEWIRKFRLAFFFQFVSCMEREGGKFPDPILNLAWNYTDPQNPSLLSFMCCTISSIRRVIAACPKTRGFRVMHWLSGLADCYCPDKRWLNQVNHYIRNEGDLVPPQDRFNAGQKLFYWLMYYGTLLLLISGLVMWVPEWIPFRFAWIRWLVIFVHEGAALLTIGGFIIHVYMSVFLVPSTWPRAVKSPAKRRKGSVRFVIPGPCWPCCEVKATALRASRRLRQLPHMPQVRGSYQERPRRPGSRRI